VDLDTLIGDLGREAYTVIDRETLDALLAAAVAIREDDTLVAGMIRILDVRGMTVVQEETPDGKILVRRTPTREQANHLLDSRLEIYERMWDGCGCKVDYFD
jgi:hypothetical protein